MKSTEYFKNVIQAYLEHEASCDELFAVAFAKPTKTLDECINYILTIVQQSGCNGFLDDEIYSYAQHFYWEDDIKVGKPENCSIIVNHTIELTEEEKEQARKDAIQRVQNEAYAKMTQSRRATTKKKEVQPQATLFDF